MSYKRELNRLKQELAELKQRGSCSECGTHTCWEEGGLEAMFNCRRCKPKPVFIKRTQQHPPPCGTCGYFPFRIPFDQQVLVSG